MFHQKQQQAYKQASKRFITDILIRSSTTPPNQPSIHTHTSHIKRHHILNHPTHSTPQPVIMTTYAAYTNLSSPTGSIYHRNPSTTSSSSITHNDNTATSQRKGPRKEKWYTFLLPTETPSSSPGLIYDPVVSRPASRRGRTGQ
jgi:hypothetical protein